MSERSAGTQGGNSGSYLVPLGLRELLDASPDLVFACDSDGALLWLGRAYETITGRVAAEQVGRHWSALVAPHGVARAARLFLRQRRRHTPVVETTIALLAQQGDEVWVTARVSLLERADGGVVFVGAGRVMSRESEAGALAAVLAATRTGQEARGTNETLPLSDQQSSASTTGQEPAAGEPEPSARPPEEAQPARRSRNGLLSLFTRGNKGGASEPDRQGAQPRPAAKTEPHPPTDPGAPAEGAPDGTGLAQRIEELTSELEESRALAQAKGEFLATMAHEIRTPMNGMMGMAHLLLETDLNGDQRGMVEVVLHSGQALLDLINDTLDFSRAESGKLELERLAFDLRVTVNEIASLLAPLANEKGVNLECQVRHEVPSRVWGDPGRLRQVLLNLGGNAIKFTEKGSVTLTIERVREDERCVTLRFGVRDMGIGMTEEQRGRIFKVFEQADPSIARRFGGTGLGLTISSRLVTLMGGKVAVESEPGEGSRFFFDVTLEKQQEAGSEPEPSPDRAGLAGLRVLVVDPSAAMRRSFTAKLEARGCRVESVETAERALELLHEAVEAGDPFRVTMTERELPGMNGEELGAAIRADGAHDGTLTMLITAVGRRGDAARARARGFSAYLMKPLDWEELAGGVAEVLYVAAATPPGETPPLITRHSLAEARRSRMRILLVEDSAVSQIVTEWTLGRLGYRLRKAGTVAAALEACDQESFDLVLLDINLPDGDGFALTREIRAREVSGLRVPIVAMTGSNEPDDRDRCIAAGMDEYVPKPVDLGLLCRVVERLTAPRTAADAGPSDEQGPDPESKSGEGSKAPSGLERDVQPIEAKAGMEPCGSCEACAHRGAEELEPGGSQAGKSSASFEMTNAAAILGWTPASVGQGPAEVAATGVGAEPGCGSCGGSAGAEPGHAPPAQADAGGESVPRALEVEPGFPSGAEMSSGRGDDPVERIPDLEERPGDLSSLSGVHVVPLGEEAAADAAPGQELAPPVDLQRLEVTCMGIPALRESLLNTFLTEVRPRLERLGSALNEHDSRQFEMEAHGLKGMCATVGATVCADCFAELERAGREGDLETATPLLKRAYLEVTRTEAFITTIVRMAA
jgi:PAS domain S-box-containing protein